MTCAEFLYKAINEYKNDSSLNQDLLEYPNYALAYRLESLEHFVEMEEY